MIETACVGLGVAAAILTTLALIVAFWPLALAWVPAARVTWWRRRHFRLRKSRAHGTTTGRRMEKQ